MQYSASLVLAFTALASATYIPSDAADMYIADIDPRQAAAGSAAPFFTNKTFEELSISAGPAGDALAKAEKALGGLPTDLTTVAKSDIKFLQRVNTVCNQAEIAVFDPSIEKAAVGKEALSIECGKSRNKVLKLLATIKSLQISEAQKDPAFDAAKKEQLATEQKKLANNVESDRLNGEAKLTCISPPFKATTADLKATEQVKNKTRELAAENKSFESRKQLGLPDPPAAKLARENAAASVAEEKKNATAKPGKATRGFPGSSKMLF